MGSVLVHIVVSKYGEIDDEEVARVIEAMQECYRQLAPHEVSLVDLYLFERSSSVEAFFADECRKVSVASAPFGALFFAMHDAWRGIPRITLCLEKMKKLPRVVKKGGIHHEVGTRFCTATCIIIFFHFLQHFWKSLIGSTSLSSI